MLNFNELNYFLTVAQTQSFAQAGQRLGVSSSALSHSMKSLEGRLKLRLFNRTTRHVSLTDAGLQLYERLAPLYASIHSEVAVLQDFIDEPSGRVRINTSSTVAEDLLYPKLMPLLQQYPKINIEVVIDNGWVDIVKEGFDMGVRLGEDLAKDMIAVQISPPMKMVLVASAQYMAKAEPLDNLDALDRHTLIGMRLSSQHGSELEWEFSHQGKLQIYKPKPQFSINNHLRKQATLDGLGITWLPLFCVEKELANGQLLELLPDYAITYEPLFLYYPSRRGHSKVFNLVVEALRYL